MSPRKRRRTCDAVNVSPLGGTCDGMIVVDFLLRGGQSVLGRTKAKHGSYQGH